MVIRSGHFPACNPICIQLWQELFDLSWLQLYLQHQIHKPYNGSHVQGMHKVMRRALAAWCSAILSFKLAWILICLTIYVPVRVGGLLQSLQWCVGYNNQSFSSGIPVWGSFKYVFQCCSSVPSRYSPGRPVVTQCTLGQSVAFQWHSSVHWTSQCTLAQGKSDDKSAWVQVMSCSLQARNHLMVQLCS